MTTKYFALIALFSIFLVDGMEKTPSYSQAEWKSEAIFNGIRKEQSNTTKLLVLKKLVEQWNSNIGSQPKNNRSNVQN